MSFGPEPARSRQRRGRDLTPDFWCDPELDCRGVAENPDGGVGATGTCVRKAVGDPCTSYFFSLCPKEAFCDLPTDGGRAPALPRPSALLARSPSTRAAQPTSARTATRASPAVRRGEPWASAARIMRARHARFRCSASRQWTGAGPARRWASSVLPVGDAELQRVPLHVCLRPRHLQARGRAGRRCPSWTRPPPDRRTLRCPIGSLSTQGPRWSGVRLLEYGL